MQATGQLSPVRLWLYITTIVICLAILATMLIQRLGQTASPPRLNYEPRKPGDTSGYSIVHNTRRPWPPDAPLVEVSKYWHRAGYDMLEQFDQRLTTPNLTHDEMISCLLGKASLQNYESDPAMAYQTLEKARALALTNNGTAASWLYTIIYTQGVAGLRRGEDDNCIMCRGESSCIIPISPSAVHANRLGSELAVKHFMEYLEQFPDDFEVRWLLNLAHMTLGEHPHRVDGRFLINLDHFYRSDFGIGKFRDVGHLAGVNRFNQSGGAIMEDFDNDGLLDLVVTSFDPTAQMSFYRNKGDGTFEERTREPGFLGQLGGLYCVQTDYNNDGHMDILIMRGAWLKLPIRPTLMRNNGDGTFTDVTK